MTNRMIIRPVQLLLSVGSVLIAIGSSQVEAATLNVGPLSLGMTNDQVVKFASLRDCKLEGDQMVCHAEGLFGGQTASAILKFETKTKRLGSIELSFSDWRSDDPRLPDLYSQLNFHKCRPDMIGSEPDWYSKEECYEPPDQIRRITWDGGFSSKRGKPGRARSINISVFKHEGVYRAFIRKKAAEKKSAKQAEANKDFARGK